MSSDARALSRKTSSDTIAAGGAVDSSGGSAGASGAASASASAGLGGVAGANDLSDRWELLSGGGETCTACAAAEVARVEQQEARTQARLNAYKSSELALRQQFRDALGHITTAIEMHPNVSEYYLQK